MRLVDKIRHRAYDIARSGKCSDCEAVERQLQQEGYAEAAMALNDAYVRQHVIELCAQRGGPRRAEKLEHRQLIGRYLRL